MDRQTGVFMYNSLADLNVTTAQPRDTNFMGRIAFIGSNFIIVLGDFAKKQKEKNIVNKEKSFWCVQNERQRNTTHHEIHVSWLYMKVIVRQKKTKRQKQKRWESENRRQRQKNRGR